MAEDAVTYRARAATERTRALTETLENVKDRCDRAAKAWDVMADRAERVDTQKREREAASHARALTFEEQP